MRVSAENQSVRFEGNRRALLKVVDLCLTRSQGQAERTSSIALTDVKDAIVFTGGWPVIARFVDSSGRHRDIELYKVPGMMTAMGGSATGMLAVDVTESAEE